MLTALLRAVSALSVPQMRRVVALSLGLTVVTFAVLWLAVAATLYNTAFFDWRPLNWLVNLLGGLGVLVLSWLLFPAIVTLIMSFYLERVAAAVEAADYPGRGPPRPQSVGEIVSITSTGVLTIPDGKAVAERPSLMGRAPVPPDAKNV